MFSLAKRQRISLQAGDKYLPLSFHQVLTHRPLTGKGRELAQGFLLEIEKHFFPPFFPLCSNLKIGPMHQWVKEN